VTVGDRLTGRTVLITGAAGGIGSAVAHRFAAEGATVGVADYDEKSAGEVAERINASGGRALGLGVDVADQDAAAAVVSQFRQWAGSVSGLVNVAGNSRFAMFDKLTEVDWRSVLAVHLDGTYHCCRAVVDHLPRDGQGRIINVTSAAGLTGAIGQANYGAAKAGIIGLTKSLAKELGPRGITVNAVAPLAHTAMTSGIAQNDKLRDMYLNRIALRRIADPDETAGAFVFLASDDASYVTGQILCVDGGLVM
jgi:3-oxoacyl-[acyl-carrier protein] reductase